MKCISLWWKVNYFERCKLLVLSTVFNLCFPFHHIEDDSDFSKALCTKDKSKLDERHFSDNIFNPMDILDREMKNLLDESEPDLHFYNEINQKSIRKCNYLTEYRFKDQISLYKSSFSALLSFCRINIRSLIGTLMIS